MNENLKSSFGVQLLNLTHKSWIQLILNTIIHQAVTNKFYDPT